MNLEGENLTSLRSEKQGFSLRILTSNRHTRKFESLKYKIDATPTSMKTEETGKVLRKRREMNQKGDLTESYLQILTFQEHGLFLLCAVSQCLRNIPCAMPYSSHQRWNGRQRRQTSCFHAAYVPPGEIKINICMCFNEVLVISVIKKNKEIS